MSCVTVSCLAAASSSTVESTARRRLPARTPVSVTTSNTASMIRWGRSLAARRLRQYVSVEAWNAAWVSPKPQAAFHRRSKVKASAVPRSDRPSKTWRTRTEPITEAGIAGLPRRTGNRSSIIESGNNRSRCSARNAKALPGANNSPASACTSNNPRWACSNPCIHQVLMTTARNAGGAP